MKKQLVLLLLLTVCNKVIMAQDFIDDAAIWMNIYVEKKINRYWDVHLNQQNRINENVTKFGMAYADVGFTFNLNKHVSILGDYVLISRRRIDDTYSTRHQAYTALILRYQTGRWRFVYRNMLQAQVKDIYTSEDGKVPIWYERNKITVKYELSKRFTLYTAEELYYPLDQKPYRGLDRSRTFGGLFYKLGRHTQLEGYFLYQRELNAFGPTNRDYIYGIGLEHKF